MFPNLKLKGGGGGGMLLTLCSSLFYGLWLEILDFLPGHTHFVHDVIFEVIFKKKKKIYSAVAFY